MIQKKYELDDAIAEDDVVPFLIDAIASDPDYRAASEALLLVFSPLRDPQALMADMGRMRAALPGLTVVGATALGSNNPQVRLPSQPVCTLLLFETAHARVDVFDCHHATPAEAGADMAQRLGAGPNPRAVLVLTADVTLYPADFIDTLHQEHPGLPIVGEAAGKTRLDTPDDSFVWANDQLITRGLVCVTFCGDNLHVQADHNLGWRPVGRTMYVTRSEGVGNVLQIDGRPALDMYERYLGVTPDAQFYDNVCAFPLLEHAGERLVARVPFAHRGDGALMFSMRMNENVPLSLSYSRPEYVLSESLASANRMAAFQPQALLLFACINRRIFMGNEGADREFGYYGRAQAAAVWTYGCGELFLDDKGGGVLNSSLVALGLREGAANPALAPAPYDDPDIHLDTAYIPLAERMVTFLEAATTELNDTIGTLEVLAEHDQLTGIYNRRRTEAALAKALEERTAAEPLSLLMYDIDHFKEVNDTYGHDQGDVVLRELTQVVRAQVREQDAVGRWGGEEFLVICAGATRDEARQVAERVRRAVMEHSFSGIGRVTISVGVAQAADGDTAATLFSRVDKALYDAKRAGRNTVRTR